MPRNRRKKKAASAAAAAASAAAAPAVEESKNPYKIKADQDFRANNLESAVKLYTQALEMEPDNRAIYSNRCAAYMGRKEETKALADAEKCIELSPDWPRGYYRKGQALEALMRYADAQEAYVEGLKQAPADGPLTSALKKITDLLNDLQLSSSEVQKEGKDAGENPEEDKFQNMIKWMLDGGSQFPLLYMRYYSEDYRGVHALTRVPKDTRILYVPHSHVMTSEKAKASEIGRKLLERHVNLHSKHSYLACYLLEERADPNSFWKPYIDILPVKYRNMPIFFTEEELSWLKGSFTLDKIYGRRQSLAEEYERVCNAIPEFRRHSCDDFIWARLVVITRIFGMKIKDHKTDGLVPYADMLNHKIPRETSWTFEDSCDGFTITATKALARGAEVFDSYGRKCNSRFFVNYGFTLAENEDNEVVMNVVIPPLDPLYRLKIQYLANNEANAIREFQVPANYAEPKTKEMFTFLRFAHATDKELTVFPRPKDGVKFEGTIENVGRENEIKVLQHLKRCATAVMNAFPTTIEEDEKILADNEAGEVVNNWNVKNCVQMRLGEKRVLRWYIQLADKCVPMLNQSWSEIKRQATKGTGDPAFDQYVSLCIVPLVNPKQRFRSNNSSSSSNR